MSFKELLKNSQSCRTQSDISLIQRDSDSLDRSPGQAPAGMTDSLYGIFQRVLNKTLFVLIFLNSTITFAQTQNTDLQCAEKKSIVAETTTSRDQKRKLTLEGITCAENCLESSFDKTGCYYWRAVNRALLLETGLANPKDHIPKMVADFKKVIQLQPTYDAGGAYRSLGWLYLQLPAIPLWGDEFYRNLSLARDYSQKAMGVSANDPYNLQLAGEIALAQDENSKALKYLQSSLQQFQKSTLTPELKQKNIAKLQRLIQKTKKRSP